MGAILQVYYGRYKTTASQNVCVIWLIVERIGKLWSVNALLAYEIGTFGCERG